MCFCVFLGTGMPYLQFPNYWKGVLQLSNCSSHPIIICAVIPILPHLPFPPLLNKTFLFLFGKTGIKHSSLPKLTCCAFSCILQLPFFYLPGIVNYT